MIKESKMIKGFGIALMAVFAGFIFGFAVGYEVSEYKTITSGQKEKMLKEAKNDKSRSGVKIVISSDGNEAIVSYQKDSIAQEPNLSSFIREKYKNTTTIVERVDLPQQVIDLGNFPLMTMKSEPNLILSYTSAKDLNSIQSGLEEWDKLNEAEKKEITEKIKSAITDLMINQFKSLSYKDIESEKRNYQNFFKTLSMANNKKYQNIKVDVNFPQAAEELKKIKEFLKNIKDVNSKRE